MSEPASLGADLRRERERRGLTLRSISESTKVSASLLEGLESDDVSRWPGGIFRRAFVRAYAQCVGLDADEIVRRFELQHRSPDDPLPVAGLQASAEPFANATIQPRGTTSRAVAPGRVRLLGTAADLTVAAILAFGSAAAGSRLLWPVLLIGAYYAAGILLTGTSPMVALLGDGAYGQPAPDARDPETPQEPVRPATERRHERHRRRHRHRNVQAGARS